MTEEQYTRAKRVIRSIEDWMSIKQAIADTLEKLSRQSSGQLRIKVETGTNTNGAITSADLKVSQREFVEYLREEISRIDQETTALQEEFHGI